MQYNRTRLFEGKQAGLRGSGSGAGDSSFNGNRAITRQTPGMVNVIPGTLTVIDFLEKVFYPQVDPATLKTVYYGTTAKDGINYPITDDDINNLGYQLRADRFLNLDYFGGGNTYLVFAFPSGFGSPKFIVNGLNNTAFNLVRVNSDFVNSQGDTVKIYVYVSIYKYNSALDSLQIA